LDQLAGDLEHGVRDFVSVLLAQLEVTGFANDITQVDHVCYRVATVERYEVLKASLAPVATLLSEAWINGRPIASYKLAAPIQVTSRVAVDVLELPSPRADATYEEGFEHIEVVTAGALEELLARHPEQAFDRRNLHAKVNRDVSLRFGCGLVKFHEASLAQIIAAEQAVLAARPSRPLAVIDFDDTVLVSREPFLKAVQAALAAWLGRPLDLDEVRAKARPTFPDFFANFGIQDAAAVQALVAAFQTTWRRYAAECRVPAGIPSLLSCLYSEGVDVHIWTARDEGTTRETLDGVGLSAFVTRIHAFDGKSPGKPVPPGELAAVCRAAASVVMLGDSLSDMVGARALGAAFVQAAWVHASDLDVAPDVLCRTPLQALARMLTVLR